MKQITCRCEAVVELDAPEIIDLDTDPALTARLATGDFASALCPRCGAVVRAELPLRIVSKTAGMELIVLPELERLAAYRGKADVGGSAEILLGYQELFERARMLRDGLAPQVMESLKYALQCKAEESEPEADVTVLFNGFNDGAIEFHILGLKSGQAGVVRMSRTSYDKMAAELPSIAGKEPYRSIYTGRYRSIKKLGFLSSSSDA